MDQQELQDAQHQLALDQQQLQGAQHQTPTPVARTCGLAGGQTLGDMQAKAVLASIVPPELREHRLLRAFSKFTGCPRVWVRDAAARNAAPAPLHSSGRAVHFDSAKRRDNRGNQGISQSDFDAVRTFLHNHSKPSPSRKDLRTWRSVIMTAAQFHGKEEPTNTVTDTKRFTDCSVPDLHRMYKQEQAAAGQPAVSLHTFMALMPPWIARLSAAQRQVCVCKTCCNVKLVLTVLAQHKAGLALELPGPAPGATVPFPAGPDPGTAAPPPRALGEDGIGDTAHLLAADSPFVDPNAEFEHHHPDHHLPVPPPFVAASPTHLSATTVRGLYMCSCGPDAPHQARCCHRTCSDCKDKCMKLKPGVDGSIMLSVKQYAPVKQKEGPARIELQQFKLSLREVVDKLNEQMPSYIWHHFVAHHQLAVFRRQQQAVQEKGDHGRVVISCDWSERLTVERPTEIQSDHWHHHNVGIFVACAYFRNDKDEYREETVYILTDGKDQSAAVTQAALHQVLDYLQGERCMVMKQLCMWSDGCAAQFKGTPALQLHRRMAMSDKKEDAECLRLLHARAPHIASAHMTLNVHLLKEYARECLGWKGKRLTQKKPLLRADILEHLRWEQEMEEDQLAEVGVDEADEMDARWGHKRPRTCLGRGAQQQLTMDQQHLQGAQHQLAVDQQQLLAAEHSIKLALHLSCPAQPLALQHLCPLPPGLAPQPPPPGALGAAGEDGDGVTAHLLAADSPFVDPNGEFEHPHPHHHLPVPPPVLATSPTQLSATTVRGLYMCPCGPDAPHQARCCHRTCSDCKDKPGVDGSIMLSVKQYAPVKQKEGPARIELQQFRLSLREVVGKLNEQMPSYIWHHFVAHHQLAVFRRQQQAVQEKGDHGRVVISCDWSERLTVERPTEIQSDHWHHHNVGIFVACAYFRNDRDEYREETVYVLTDGKDQSAAVTQAALHQVLDYLLGERCMVMKQLSMWSDGCAAQFKGTPALQLHRRMAMRYKVSVWWSYGATSHFKGRHDSEGGVLKHSMAARVLADHPALSAECKAQQLAGDAAQLAASVAHQTRGSVQRRWCLVLKDEEVEQCAEPDPDAHRLLRTISGSRAMHAMFFPADGVAPMWTETACACVRHMGSKPQQCMCHGASNLSSIPMFGRVTLASDKEEDVECLKLLHARAPHIASSYMTLTVHLLKEYARGCLGWKGKRMTQNKPLLRADILEHLRWEQEMEEDQLAEVGVNEADDM
ncbi:hypothetical protein QJQ45_028256 [Haematococcus lacustris]|nr:hypothetical protein QJQ45_028256 [Haematococcus lacustris]